MAAVSYHGKRQTKIPRDSPVAAGMRNKRRADTSIKQHRKKVFGAY